MPKLFTHKLFFVIICYSTLIFGQNNTDTLTTKSYKEIYSFYKNNYKNDTLTARELAKYYLIKAKYNRDTTNIIKGYEYQLFISSYTTKLKYYDSIINLTKNNPTKKYPANSYFKKARIYLYEIRDVEKSLKNIKNARKYAETNNNLDLSYRIEYLIGNIKSEHLNEKDEAIKIFKKCASYYSKETKDLYKFKFLYTTHVIAETYIGLNKNDSASFYNNFGYKKAINSKDANLYNLKSLFTICEGINQYHMKNYQLAIDSIHNSLPTIIKIKNKPNIIDGYFYLGISYYKTNKKDSAIYYFKKMDSILDTQKSTPQYKHVKTYEYLKNYYKNINDVKNHNKYLSKLNTILDHYINDKIYISAKVKEDYDIPVLLDEQKSVIKNLNKTNSNYSYSILLLLILLIVSSYLIYYQYIKRKKYLQRYKELMKSQYTIKKKEPSINSTSKHTNKKQLDIPEKHITHILQELEKFENEKLYLSAGLSSKNLADKMETNVKYLSKVINFYKNKTFTTYLNELRINHAVYELKNNITLHKYTIKAIAEEMGYNSAETFSNAFFKLVGIKPSYFINQLRKEKKPDN